jgi:hypothetical protein
MYISFSVCNYFAPRQDRKIYKLSIVSIAHSTGGMEGKVGVVVGVGSGYPPSAAPLLSKPQIAKSQLL